MFLLCLVALTGTLSFSAAGGASASGGHDSPLHNEQNSVLEKVVHLKEPLIQQPDYGKHPPIPLPKPAEGAQKPSHDDDERLFNFHPDNHDSEISWERDLLNAKHTDRQKEVIEAMKHSWDAYKNYAWGADHLRPLTKTKQNWFGVGLTIVDSIDTLLLMGMKKEYEDALAWIQNDLTFDVYKDVNCFEMTIRVLGGLESAFHLTKNPTLLAKAVDVGDRLIHCFDSPSESIPFSDVNLRTKTPRAPAWSVDSSLSEVATVQLEFRDLSRLVKEDKFEVTSFKASEHIHAHVHSSKNPLLPMYISPNTGRFTPSTVTMGARGDSYYEYLIKQYLQTGTDWLRDDYLDAVDAIKARLIKTTFGQKKLTYVAELLRNSDAYSPKMDHLVCFFPGTLALGYYHHSKSKQSSHRGQDEQASAPKNTNWSDNRFESHLALAEELARTCYEMYNMTATGLAPEIVYFGIREDEEEIYVRPADTHNLLRPEYVESLFYLYHITGNEIYRRQGAKVKSISTNHHLEPFKVL